ncbi:MAG: hypothetical protein ACE5PV_01485, partial [Candidatus Poribacteria bacterium]
NLRCAVLLVVSLLFFPATSYPDVRISGSARNEISLINRDGTLRYGNRSDLYLKFVSLSEGAKLVAELDFYTLYGYFSSMTAGADDRHLATTSQLLKDGQFYIDRLYLKFPVSRADVILGKQRIAWGTGVVFSPTDNFNRPNPLNLSGRKEGINALVTKIFIGDLSSLDFIVAPADIFQGSLSQPRGQRIDDEINLERLKYSKFASRLTFNRFKTDIALSYQYDGEARNHIYGLDIKGDLKLGYHLETVFIYNRDVFDVKDIADYWQSVLGLDYSFRGKWFLLGEYFYNGPGKATETALPASDFSLLDEFRYRHYLYLQVLYQYDILLGANASLLWNMIDRSFILLPAINYSLFQNTELNLYSNIFFGDETDEYGPGRLGGDQVYYLRLTVKF